jgi:phage major head subunit gpT-like protein
MIINQQALRGIFTGFKTIFAKAFDNSQILYDKVATKVPSETGEESYKWLGMIPRLREWIGERQIKNLEASDYTIKNKPFEVTVGVPREDIEDDKIGIYAPMIQSMGQSAATHPDELVFELLKNGFSNKCYDGKAFFATDHKVGKKSISNKGTAKLTLESYTAARAAIMSLTDDDGKPLKIIPDTLVVPPALEAKAREILLADQISGTTNTMKGTAQPLPVTDLAGADEAWYLLCTSLPIKPLIYQERKAPTFVAKNQESDDNMFFDKQAIYGVDSRGNAGYGFWQMAYGSDGSANA